MRAWYVVAGSLWCVLCACSAPHTGVDAQADTVLDAVTHDTPTVGDIATDLPFDVAADVRSSCHADTDCTDALFCNGAERCMPGATGADARGCLPALSATPCAASQTCDETSQRCLSNCDVSADADHDGHRAIACGGDDCDDNDANRFPGNAEVCDPHHDEDCDPCTFATAATSTTTSDGDHDGDTYVSRTCGNVYTGAAPTVCDPRDLLINTATMLVSGSDCDDSNRSVHPAASEVCNGIDDNCDGTIDEGLPQHTYYPDCDGDNFGDSLATGMRGCAAPTAPPTCAGTALHPQWVTTAGDCNDANASVNSGAPEVCNGIDDNCDGSIDEGLPRRNYFADCDGDNFGSGTAMLLCAAPGTAPACAGTPSTAQWVNSPGDCNDMNASVNPGATEVCNGVDDNCDGSIDEGLPRRNYYADCDGDNFGTGTAIFLCTVPAAAPSCTGSPASAQWVNSPGDCNDSAASVHPGAAEVCNGIDDNCDGNIDEGLPHTTYFPDCDGDNYGTGTGLSLCALPTALPTCGSPSPSARWASVGLDCNDSNAAVHPTAMEVCNNLDDDCNGMVDDYPAELSCPVVANTTNRVCTAGTCAIGSCTANHADCNHVEADGCEIDLTNTITSCGACGNVCAAMAHATVNCASSVCGFTCIDGFTNISAVCDLQAPRPIWPTSTASVSTRRPTFRWALPSTGIGLPTGGHVQVCADRACVTILTEFDGATATSGTPSVDLPPGVVFWRVRGRNSFGVAPGAGATWEVVVPQRTAVAATAWGTDLDLNGDGFAEVVVGAVNADGSAGRAYVYYGHAAGISLVPDVTLLGPDGASGNFGYTVVSAGDVNGDGFADLAVSAPYAPFPARTGRVHIYFGGPTGIGTTPGASLSGPLAAASGFGYTMTAAGDLNGDGYGDLAVGAPGANSQEGEVFVYLGRPNGSTPLGPSPDVTLRGGAGSFGIFGSGLAAAGDRDGDGLADLAVGQPIVAVMVGTTYVQPGRAFVFHGNSATGLNTTTTDFFTAGSSQQNYGTAITLAGDVDGDGHADLLINAPSYASNAGRVYVDRGPTIGASSTAINAVDPGLSFSRAMAGGDVNGDGYADAIISAPAWSTYTGRTYVFLGPTFASPAVTLTGVDGNNGNFGTALSASDDVNGDHLADLVDSATGAHTTGAVYLFNGNAAGVVGTATATLLSPDSSPYASSVGN